MGDSDDTRKFKIMMAMFAAFLGLMVVSCQELKYTLWGKTAVANVSKMEEVMVRKSGKFSGEEPRMRIHFTYDDAGTHVRMIDSYPIDLDFTEPRTTGKLRIQYLSGDKYSARMAGTGKGGAVALFFVMLGMLAFYIIKCWRDAQEPVDSP